jgi:two-component sensor histidine kinase
VQGLEASEYRLLKEVDHRARNVLAVVSGIVRLSRAEGAARYANAIQQRVHALADAHTLLTERGWREAPLETVLRKQFAGVDPQRVRLAGPNVYVSAFVVQPLALIIQELTDNAITHGALSRAGGTVDVTWEDSPQFGGFVLSWRETGAAHPKPQGSPGYGAAMLNAMVEGQLRGEIQREWGSEGLKIRISVPGPSKALPAPPT